MTVTFYATPAAKIQGKGVLNPYSEDELEADRHKYFSANWAR